MVVTPIVQWKRHAFNTLKLPQYQTSGAAGFDLEACLTTSQATLAQWTSNPESLILRVPPECDSVGLLDSRILVNTGFDVAIPDGYELQIRPRSGIAIRHQIIVLNSPGTIDSDYRGTIIIGLKNIGVSPFIIKHGMRIAQAVLTPVTQAQNVEVFELSETIRGTGGLGSTGV